jgi:hypothetical protein
VTIYTFQIDTGAPASRRCCPPAPATRRTFFMLTQPCQIATAFPQIDTEIAKLRVTR